MPVTSSSVGFVLTKWILIVVFLTSTVLAITAGIINIIYAIQFINEVSRYDRTNGVMLFVLGIFAIAYGGAMYYTIRKLSPENWIEPFLVISIIAMTLFMIFGTAGLSVGYGAVNDNIAHYLRMLYHANNEYTHKTLEDIHQYYECCGLHNNRTQVQILNGTVTWSCCKHGQKGVACNISKSYSLGCEEPITSVHNRAVYSLGSVWISMGTVFLVTVLLAFYFQKAFTRRPG